MKKEDPASLLFTQSFDKSTTGKTPFTRRRLSKALVETPPQQSTTTVKLNIAKNVTSQLTPSSKETPISHMPRSLFENEQPIHVEEEEQQVANEDEEEEVVAE